LPLDDGGGSKLPMGGTTVIIEKLIIEAADYLQGEAVGNAVVQAIQDKLARQ
jgi:hypothetical protein